MVGMPYLLLGAFGLLLYRAYKKAPAQSQLAGAAATGGTEGLSCSTPSRAGSS